jgi:hypothetical protein
MIIQIQQPDDGNQIAGNGQLRAANVRIRQPSPHQQQKQPSTNGNGQSATAAAALTANRIRQSTGSAGEDNIINLKFEKEI